MAFGGRVYSIRDGGVMLFGQPLGTQMGGVLIDLATAPIPPGDYQLNVEIGVGGVEIFLPHYVQFFVNGGPGFGGHEVHRGHDVWHKLVKKLHDTNLPEYAPEEVTREPSVEQPVLLRINLKMGVGGVDIYQL